MPGALAGSVFEVRAITLELRRSALELSVAVFELGPRGFAALVPVAGCRLMSLRRALVELRRPETTIDVGGATVGPVR